MPVLLRNILAVKSKLSFVACAITLALAPWLASAQAVATPGELRKLTDQLMERVGKGDLAGGFKMMKSRTVIPAAEFDSMVGQAELQMPVINQRFGKSIGHEFLREDKVGDSLIRYTYLHRLENHAMRWTFYSYRGKNGWTINAFRFDDQIQGLFP
jgi:hypothetical protein